MGIGGFFVVAFVATFILSRVFFWLLRRWNGGWLRLLAAHGASLAICWAFFAFGSSDGEIYLSGGAVFLLPQGVWLLVDHLRGKSGREE